MVDSVDGNTAETALTIANTDIKIWKAGATTLANKNSGGATHISNGNYYAVLDATDTDTLGSGALVVQVSGALAVRHDFCVMASNVYDSMIGGGAVLAVNASQISGDSTAADNLETAFDDTAGAVPWLGVIDQGTAQSATSTTLRLRSAATFADSEPVGSVIVITGGTTGVGQVRQITSYVSSTDTATVDAWTTTPSGTITYKLLAAPPTPTTLPSVNVTQISGDSTAADNLEAALDGTGGVTISAALTGNITGNLSGSVGSVATGGITAASIAADAIGASEIASDAIVEIAAGVWDRVISGANHNITNSAGKRLRELTNSVVTSGTAQAGGTASITLASAASSTDGTYDPGIVRISAGTGLGQARMIIQYVGSTRVASVDRDWRVVPDNTSEYEIIASQNLISTNEGLAQGGGANTITLNASASATNDIYNGQLVVLRTGTGQDQSRIITAYNGTTKVATVAEAWATNPASGTGYILWPVGRALTASISSGAQGDIRTALGLASANLDTQLTAIDDAVDTEVGAIKIVTDKLNTMIQDAPGSPAEYRFTADALETAPTGSGGGGGGGASASDIADAVWSISLPGAFSAGEAGYIVGTNIDAVVSTRASQSSLDTLDNFVDTEVAAIKAVTDRLDTTLEAASGSPGEYRFTADALETAPAGVSSLTASAIADAVWDEAVADHLSAGTFGKAVDDTDDRGSRTVIRGTVSSGTTTTLTPSALSPAGVDADQFKGRIIVFDNNTTTAALRGQATDITANTGATLPVFTFTALTAAPQSSDTFSIL